MKTVLYLNLFLAMLGYVSVCRSAVPEQPVLDIEAVAVKAENYLAEDVNRDLRKADCYIRKIEFVENATSRNQSYWSVFWSGRSPEAACFAEMRVFGDGSIIRVLGYQ